VERNTTMAAIRNLKERDFDECAASEVCRARADPRRDLGALEVLSRFARLARRTLSQRPHRSEVSPGDGVCVQTKPGVAAGRTSTSTRRITFASPGRPRFAFIFGMPEGLADVRQEEVRDVGENMPYALIVPAGVVHAYKNVGGQGRAGVQRRQSPLRGVVEAGPGG